MAIRAIDLQLSILQGPLVAGTVQHAEVATQQALAIDESRFAALLTERDESVQRIQRAAGNKVGDRLRPDYERPDRPAHAPRRQAPPAAAERLERLLGPLPSSDTGSVIDVTA